MERLISMNIFKFEFKYLYKQIIIWTISLSSIFIIFSAMFPAYHDNKDAVAQMFATYPPEVLKALGIDINIIFSFNGFYSFILTYILLLAVIMSLYLSISVFAREKKNKTSDFLLVKPISRQKIFLTKLAASGLSLIIINLLYLMISLTMFDFLNGINKNDFLLIFSSLFIVEIIFFAMGIFLSIMLPKIKNIGNITTGVGFIFFIIGMVAGILDQEWLNYLTPFKYFDSSYILKHHALDSKYIILSIVIISYLLSFSYISYLKRDIDQVS